MKYLSITPPIIDPIKKLPEGLPDKYDDIILRIAGKYNIEFSVIKKIIAIESNYNLKEVSGQAFGLMQVMKFQLSRLKIPKSSIFNPSINIDAGSRILREIYNQINSWHISKNPNTIFYLALAAYNAGPTKLKRTIAKYGLKYSLLRMPKETQDYILKYKHLDKILQGVQTSQLNREEIILAGKAPIEIKASRPQWTEEDINFVSNMPVLPVEPKRDNYKYIIYSGIIISSILIISMILKKEK